MKTSRFAAFLLVTILLFCFGTQSAQGQSIKVNKKPGAVSIAELQMTSYERDTSAAAVILYTGGERYINFSSGYGVLVTKSFQRIKILKESGRKHADFEIILNTKRSPSDVLAGVKVVTYNLEGGKIVQTKLSKEHIYETKVNDVFKKVSFAAENVKVGSVIEVQWERSGYYAQFMPNLSLQADIPINFGEIQVAVPPSRMYARTMHGIDLFNCEVKNEYDGANNSVDTYTIRDMPAFRTEPRSIAPEQYLVHARYTFKWIQGGISNRSVSGSGWTGYGTYRVSGIHNSAARRYFNGDWPTIDTDLAESDIFQAMYGICPLPKEVDRIVSQGLSNEETIQQIRAAIIEKVSWNDEIDIMPEPGLMTSMNHKGTNADINAIMSTCLQRAGFEVLPVFLKLRSSGKINVIDINEFDTFVLYAVKGNDAYYFDAADGNAYLNVLPEDMLVTDARMVNRQKQGQWVDLSKLCANSESHVLNASLSEDGQVHVEAVMKFQGSSAYDFKSFYKSFGDQEKFMDALQQMLNGYTIESCEVTAGEQWSPDFALKLSLSQTAPMAGDQFIVNPFTRDFFSTSAFKSETRKLPVEFDYREDVKYNLALTIPQGYKFTQIPQNYFLYGEQLDCPVRLMCSKMLDNTLALKYNLTMGTNTVPAAKYPQFREFWDKMCNIFKERVVISKVQQ